MKRTLTILTATSLSLGVYATPFDKGDAKKGEELHKKMCISCHAARFGGDGSKIYTRKDRRVKNAEALKQQIATCNTMLATQLFPEDELNLAAYLNATYYKFK
ncbi:MAG: cytochrome c [Thiobacillaceae bacterium]|nr:cytochrome c [Thiobacillaceae bacterium]MCX7673820.1 cytochrome c [Thiobacillaceae bacterium]MDW8323578.1 cytochrome c [Burkholderiales bacterium]